MGTGFWKGMCAGLAVGLGMGLCAKMKPAKKSHAAAKLIRAAGDAVDRVGAFLGV